MITKKTKYGWKDVIVQLNGQRIHTESVTIKITPVVNADGSIDYSTLIEDNPTEDTDYKQPIQPKN